VTDAGDRSLALLKPDAVEAGLQPQNEALAERHGLTVLERRRLWLTPDHVESCFCGCSCPEESNPIKLAFCLSYLRRGPVEAWLLEGQAALQRALALKPLVRDRFGRHEFASVMHTPSTVAELDRQLALWFPRLAPQPDAGGGRRPPAEPGWRARLGLDTRRLTAMAADLAALSDADLRRLVHDRALASGRGAYAVVLEGNPGRRPEEVVSALVRLVPLPLYDAVTAVYAALVLGRTPVAARSAPAAGIVWNALMDEDVLCTIEMIREEPS
jgi:nucleoside diphosphate kinase